MSEQITFEARLRPGHPSGKSTTTVTGQRLRLDGFELVLHNAVDPLAKATMKARWVVSAPDIGCALFSTPEDSEAEAVGRAWDRIHAAGLPAVAAIIEKEKARQKTEAVTPSA